MSGGLSVTFVDSFWVNMDTEAFNDKKVKSPVQTCLNICVTKGCCVFVVYDWLRLKIDLVYKKITHLLDNSVPVKGMFCIPSLSWSIWIHIIKLFEKVIIYLMLIAYTWHVLHSARSCLMEGRIIEILLYNSTCGKI